MRIELYINDQLFNTWEFENADYYDPACKVNHEERKKFWDKIIESCRKEIDPVLLNYPHAFYPVIPARIQPADVDPEEYEKFLLQEIENEKSIIKTHDYDRGQPGTE